MRLVLFLSAALHAAEPTLILTNGKIWTGDAARPIVQAVAMEGSRIVQLGNSSVIAKLASAKTRVVDLGGKFATPGLNDAHVHFLGGSEGLAEVDLTGICTVEEIQRAIFQWAKAHPEATWIRGRGWEYFCFPGGLPTKEQLDAVVRDRPAFLSAYDGHTGWANSKALEMAKVGRAFRFGGFGEVKLDANGEPTGALLEGAQSVVRRLVPAYSREQKLAALRAGLKYAASLGITSFQNASGSLDELSLYEELLTKGELTARVSVAMSIGSSSSNLDRFTEAKRKWTGPMLRVGALKFMMDGVIESYTAAMLEPYADNPSKSGEPAWKADEYNELVARADKAGWQIYTHAIGDRAVRMTLDGYELAAKQNGPRDRRHRIEHIETVSIDDIPRFRQIGVTPSMQPIHADPGTVEVWSKAVGEKRLPRSFAWRTLARAGAPLLFASDWPACISLDPIRGMHNAVNRRTTSGKPAGGWLPDQRVSMEETLHAYTTAGARSSFEEAIKGKIAPGMLADMVVWSQDLLTIDPMRIHQTKAAMTIFDGKVIYER